MFPKPTRKRLTGKTLAELNKAIHERDNYTCIISGQHVPLEEKFHHCPFGRDKEDVIHKGVTLAYNIHQLAHSKDGAEINRKCIEYLKINHPQEWGEK